MKNSPLYYGVGPLLYCPANKDMIAASIIEQKFGNKFSLALCLEDTINDSLVTEAEQKLTASIQQIYTARTQKFFYLPKIFIRVRNPEQILHLLDLFGPSMEIISGFILPKFSPANAGSYIQNMITANERSSRTFYMMPIFESADLIDLRTRYNYLYALKDKLAQVENLVLNIRIGGNDLCSLFGFRRHADQTIYRLRPIADFLSDIVTVYGRDYVISGPVYEYFSGYGWEEGLIHEIAEDKLCGMIGKTVIHPNQISIVNDAYKVPQKDYQDALSILQWDANAASYVAADPGHERMDERKTHRSWAEQILLLADAYGIYT